MNFLYTSSCCYFCLLAILYLSLISHSLPSFLAVSNTLGAGTTVPLSLDPIRSELGVFARRSNLVLVNFYFRPKISRTFLSSCPTSSSLRLHILKFSHKAYRLAPLCCRSRDQKSTSISFITNFIFYLREIHNSATR